MITVISGGTGSIKLIRGLSHYFDEITIISNVGDNIWLYGLYICPDIDTAIYGLSGKLDRLKGWGIEGDSFSFLDGLKKLGIETWFKLGDKDLSTHVYRTLLIKQGVSLTEITKKISKTYSVTHQIIPATDDPIETMIYTDNGSMHIQEYWVKLMARPNIKDIYYKGIENAKLNPLIPDIIDKSTEIIIAPGNPITSIEPILKIGKFYKMLSKYKDKTIAISPLIGESAFSGPAIKYLRARNLLTNSIGVAKFYSEFISTFIISSNDKGYYEEIKNMQIQPMLGDILFDSEEKEKDFGLYLYKMLRQ